MAFFKENFENVSSVNITPCSFEILQRSWLCLITLSQYFVEIDVCCFEEIDFGGK